MFSTCITAVAPLDEDIQAIVVFQYFRLCEFEILKYIKLVVKTTYSVLMASMKLPLQEGEGLNPAQIT